MAASSISRANGTSTASASLIDDRVCSSAAPVWSASPSVHFRSGDARARRLQARSVSFSSGGGGGGRGSLFAGSVAVTGFGMSSRGIGLFKFGPRRARLDSSSIRADATAVSDIKEKENSSGETGLINRLLSLVEGSDRGAQLQKDEQDAVSDAVDQLEGYCIPKPLESPLLFGEWDVAYSSNPTSPGGGYRTWIGRLIFKTKAMIQTVEQPNLVVNVVRFALFGFIPGQVILRGKLKPLDDKMVRVDFDPPSLQIGPLKFSYGRESNVKISVSYLDERLRLGRGSRGTVFVFTRR